MYQPTSLPGEWVFYGVETCSLRLPIAEQAKHDALQEAAGCKPALHIGGHPESQLMSAFDIASPKMRTDRARQLKLLGSLLTSEQERHLF